MSVFHYIATLSYLNFFSFVATGFIVVMGGKIYTVTCQDILFDDMLYFIV